MNYNDFYMCDIKNLNNKMLVLKNGTKEATCLKNKKLNNLYLMITSKNNKTEIQILSNIKEKYLVDSYPHLFNKKTIKNLFTFNNPTKYVHKGII